MVVIFSNSKIAFQSIIHIFVYNKFKKNCLLYQISTRKKPHILLSFHNNMPLRKKMDCHRDFAIEAKKIKNMYYLNIFFILIYFYFYYYHCLLFLNYSYYFIIIIIIQKRKTNAQCKASALERVESQCLPRRCSSSYDLISQCSRGKIGKIKNWQFDGSIHYSYLFSMTTGNRMRKKISRNNTPV